ncbi:MAG: hypothetical protein AAF658_05295, partial [Myxococcota bacterium]
MDESLLSLLTIGGMVTPARLTGSVALWAVADLRYHNLDRSGVRDARQRIEETVAAELREPADVHHSLSTSSVLDRFI